MQNDDEEINYVSSSPLIDNKRTKEVIQDERDLPTLRQLQRQLDSDIDSYSRIDRLVLGSKTFSTEQQLAINKAVGSHLGVYKAMVDNAITNVKEALNG